MMAFLFIFSNEYKVNDDHLFSVGGGEPKKKKFSFFTIFKVAIMHFIYIFINITWYVISFLKRDKTKKIHSPIINDDHHHQWSSSNHHNHNHTHTHRHTLSHNKHFLLEYQIFFCLLDVKLLVLFAEFIHFFLWWQVSYFFHYYMLQYTTYRWTDEEKGNFFFVAHNSQTTRKNFHF